MTKLSSQFTDAVENIILAQSLRVSDFTIGLPLFAMEVIMFPRTVVEVSVQTGDDLNRFLAVGANGVNDSPAAIPAKGQRPRDRQPLPIPTRVDQDWRLAARGPGAADDGLLRDTAFVFEDDPGPLAAGVFFSWAHRRVFHCAITASSRSRARRAGRCRDQFKSRRMRHTCPG